ncbi:uncharacterized protein Z520_02975 [Fonsecaea multimorphosa CBS 102226]|uniref:Uncharacterized protein n=1 Tax=Fonsecaea multimorphosa CBS 102226 TaxID=1442371 RepID=A0A0D2K6I0_9EURO|nr:uncharacterized protein Z520_02975 [Fonsecaea multimorphosa CBS 102226]KIY01423.1 hypothetical protein Z520_02975 [Fonsecaea multimorphosa CBS 102226]OAL28441.1 hypothetical protein AYO22_02895 [Fonsecaea multimorphosa]
MSSDSDFWVVAAPSPNFDDVLTIQVASHEVPLPAYWRILGLLEDGKREEDIVQVLLRHTGTKTRRIVTEIVDSIVENQRLITGPPRASGRLSVAFKKPRRISDYRATRIEARRELEAAEEKLETAKQREKRVLNEALILSQRKEELKDTKMTPDERRRTTRAIEHQMKHVLQKHHDVEAEINFAKRLTLIHKASLA